MGKIDFNIGEFDVFIRFLRQSVIRTNNGAVIKDFEPVSDAFAGISFKTLNEEIGGEQVRVVEVVEITTYIVSGVDNSWRVMIGEVGYEIISVEPVRRRFMKIIARRL